jgi:myosin heavy subunit
MDDEKKIILRKVHCHFVEYLDPVYIIDFLYQIGAMSKEECELIQKINSRGDRARKFMFLIADLESVTMKILFDALMLEKAYDFLAIVLQEESKKSIPIQRKAELLNRFRKELVKYRHCLKRLTHSGQHKTFEKEFNKAKANWKEVVSNGLQNKRHKEADFYFFALDAWCEYRRVIFDKTLMHMDVFKEIENLKPYMSEENLPEMMRLARYGSAILMTDKNKLDEALQYIDDAKSKFDLIHACRETGIVLYIEYNMLYQKYAETLNSDLKRFLSTIGNLAIAHFSREKEVEETVYLDFRRMVLLKLSHLYLGVGIFGVYLDAEVTTEDIKKSVSLLRCIRNNDADWTRMETRWKWSYFTAKGRFFSLQNDLEKAIHYTNKALLHAKEGGYTKEIVGSENALQSFENKLEHAKIRNKSQTNVSIKSMPTCNLENEFTRLEDKIQEKRNTLECLNKEIDNSRQLLQQLQGKRNTLEEEIDNSCQLLQQLQEKRNALECLNKEIDNSRQLLQQLQEKRNTLEEEIDNLRQLLQQLQEEITKIQTLKEMESDLVNSIKTPEKIASTQTYTIVSLLIGLVCLCLMFCCLVIVLLLYWTKTLK